MNNTISESNILPCWVCGKVWKRKETNKWYYFQEMVVCKEHKYVTKWYNAAIQLGEQKLKFEGVI